MAKINIDGTNFPSTGITQISSNLCKICGAPGLHSNYGAITCDACKIFFKRNAKKNRENFKCVFDGHCEINIHTRHTCSACRLAKCFANEMQIELIRRPLSTSNRPKRKKQIANEPTMIVSNILFSTLTVDQWNHISNLVHCYDEYGGISLAKDFISEQNALPLKLRYKLEPVSEFMTSNMSRVQQILEKNGDYLHLCSEDRLILLRHTVKHTSYFGGTFVLHQVHLFNNPLFYKTAEILFGSHPLQRTKCLMDFFDSDVTFIILIVAVLAFSTTNYTVYRNTAAINLIDMKTVLHIQDTYIELAWRYMVYKYNYLQAIKRFSHLLRCLFHTNDIIVEVNRVEEYNNIIDSVVKQTEQILSIHTN